MLQKYSFIPVISALLCGLTWWSGQIERTGAFSADSSPYNREGKESKEKLRRIDLLETLDRVVVYEHYYHSVYGHFTKLLNRIGFKPSHELVDTYDIRIVEGSTNRLLVTASLEVNGKMLEIVSVDQEFLVHANFELPKPRAEYLKAQAYKHLRVMTELPNSQKVTEQSIFKDYFEYSYQNNSNGQAIGVAKGVRAPVSGIKLNLSDLEYKAVEKDFNVELADSTEDSSSTDSILLQTAGNSSESVTKTGENLFVTNSEENHLEEEAYLAQKIFMGEMGRYAKSWSELTKIAHFRFDGKTRQNTALNTLEFNRNPAKVHHSLSQGSSESLSTRGSSGPGRPSSRVGFDPSEKPLEIEPIKPVIIDTM